MATPKKTPEAPAEALAADTPGAPPLAQEPEGGWPPDEYSGKAGTYVRDPVSGKRRPADEEDTAQGTTA